MHKRLVGIAASAVMIVAACGGSTTSSAPASTGPSAAPTPLPSVATSAVDLFGTAYKPEAGTDGGTIILGDWQEAITLQPFYFGAQTEANIINATTESLVTVTYDFKYQAQQATEIPTVDNGGVVAPGVNGDAMTVTWTLRDGLKWSDGKPETCDDYRYAWEWALDKDNVGVVTSPYLPITDWECASDTKMVLHYKETSEAYITVATAPLPRHYLEAFPMKDQIAGVPFNPANIAKMPVNGPFMYESVTPGAELRLKKNPEYTSWSTGKPTHLDGLIWKWYADADTEIAGYRAGEIDFAWDLAGSDAIKVADLGTAVANAPGLFYEFLRPNWSDTENAKDATGGCSHNAAVASRGTGCPMADPAMRQAFAYAIDKNAINERMLNNSEVVANTNISPQAWFYADEPPATFDPAKAMEILEAGGWKVGADGIREKDGLKAIVELCTTTRQVRQDTLALIAAWLKDIGVQGIPNPVDATGAIFADYNTATRETPCNLAHQNFDIAEHGFSSSIDPYGNYTSYSSTQFRPTGANDANVKNADLDTALEIVKTSVDFNAVKDAMKTFQDIYVAQTVEIPLYYRTVVEIHSPVLGNYLENTTQLASTWNAGDWFKQ
jgi:peptide/nickel transport system substrate-binding protein